MGKVIVWICRKLGIIDDGSSWRRLEETLKKPLPGGGFLDLKSLKTEKK